ncbi:hypothetical protein Bca4012_096451 [Brassica carinata]|uniref:Secreted protein n=3 Tax=Brassica TaxID=3705 RepID=A0ABQ7AF27_BRACR|nr:hypothetical protein F2Q68_00042177 [Brassica cretica]KAF3496364.1 hypothetical protein DY000_02057411 [Brassica cretica]KAG2259464.1 hypothetical protein Bca52824_078758 [Brassica carinata]
MVTTSSFLSASLSSAATVPLPTFLVFFIHREPFFCRKSTTSVSISSLPPSRCRLRRILLVSLSLSPPPLSSPPSRRLRFRSSMSNNGQFWLYCTSGP